MMNDVALTVRFKFVSRGCSITVEVLQQDDYVAPNRESSNEEHRAEENRSIPPIEEPPPPPRRMARIVHSTVLFVSR